MKKKKKKTTLVPVKREFPLRLNSTQETPSSCETILCTLKDLGKPVKGTGEGVILINKKRMKKLLSVLE